MFGTMIDYWYMTGDTSYNAATSQAMIHQASPTRDFMPINQTRTEGNDDQGFWAMASMSAAENKYPDPPPSKPGWLELTQAVFNHYVSRWDEDNCGGGLRWQIFTFNAGYNYKNSISNGCFFNIAARLARYTGNSTYADWATAIFEWEQKAGLITREFAVLDGIHVDHHHGGGGTCVNRTDTQWSYNAGIFLHGAAVMYNLTRGEVWKARVDGLVRHSLGEFARDGVIFEPACEPVRGCDYNGLSFKGYYIRWLAATIKMAPHTYEAVYPVMRKTAEAAARACSGSDASFRGVPGTACGFAWTEGGKFDGLVGVGQQMCALDAVMYTLVDGVGAAVTHDTGGTSRGNPAAGGESDDSHLPLPKAITAGDRAGAAIITIIFVGIGIGGSAFMLWNEDL
ncbi:glycosyl hydrolase family 76 protein, partial [Metarhizium hybridum]